MEAGRKEPTEKALSDQHNAVAGSDSSAHNIEAQKGLAASDAETGTAGALINASGHRQELERNFHLLNICGLGVTSGNTWIAIGGSIVSFSALWSTVAAVGVIDCS